MKKHESRSVKEVLFSIKVEFFLISAPSVLTLSMSVVLFSICLLSFISRWFLFSYFEVLFYWYFSIPHYVWWLFPSSLNSETVFFFFHTIMVSSISVLLKISWQNLFGGWAWKHIPMIPALEVDAGWLPVQ